MASASATEPERRLFVVVATGQNVSNLPPVLELARDGDLVLWIESQMAAQQQWAAGAKQIFAALGLEQLPPIIAEEINDPVQITQLCQEVAEHWRGKARPVLVTNGGTKLTPIGLIEAWRDQNPVILYGNDRPAELWTFASGLNASPERVPYASDRMTLQRILAASQHVMQPGEGVCIWPEESANEFSSEPYAVDRDYTADLHRSHFLWNLTDETDDVSGVSYKSLMELDIQDQCNQWKRSMFRIFLAANKTKIQTGPRRNDLNYQLQFVTDCFPEAMWEQIFHSTLNLHRVALKRKEKAAREMPVAAIGPAFERAVASRLLLWLNATSGAGGCVHSAWSNVKVRRVRDPLTIVAEFDLLIVLRNGILLHLECKSFRLTQKDLDARITTLHRTGSQLAQMAVCIPLFTEFAIEPWFQASHELRKRIEASGFTRCIPLTLLNQPESYSQPMDNAVVSSDCPSFEESLQKWLLPYTRRDTVM